MINLTAQPRIDSLNALRGMAALAVCWFHLVHFNPWIENGVLRMSGAYGSLGVDVFFVISGCVIPYALHRSNYQISYYGRFLIKRLLRLCPPYWVTIALVVCVGYLSICVPSFKGEPFHVFARQVLLNLTYTADIFSDQWFIYVFWTLAIEIQYYLLVGLVFFAIAAPHGSIRMAAFALLGALAFLLPSKAFVFHYLFLFILGILTFQHLASIIRMKSYLCLLGLCACGLFFTLGWPATIVGVATSCVITFLSLNNRLLQFFGDISYSVYLLHLAIYPKVFNLTMRVMSGETGITVSLILSLGLTIAAAYGLYRLVEIPAQRWSSSVRYTHRKVG